MLTEEQLCALPYSQGHLFEGAGEEVRRSLVEQLNDADSKLPGGGLKGYLERARALLRDAQAGKNPFQGLVPEVPTGQKLFGDSGPGSETYAEFERLGMQELARCAFCLVAGGLGERLGYPGIKIGITSELTTGKTFIETYAGFILAFQDHARKSTGNESLKLPLAIMTSGDTHDKTVALLSANQHFGLDPAQVTLMKQELVPALMDLEARIAVDGGRIVTKPHGHGDVHSLLHQRGLPKLWSEQGFKWILLFQDTNPLPFRSLCAVLGVSAKNGFVMNSVAVPRNPKEAIGGICRLKDVAKGASLTINVEYNQMEPLLKETPVGGDVADESGYSPYPGNINVLVFDLAGMARCHEATGGVVPEFVNPKWQDGAKTKFKSPTRLECMMQDFPRLCGEGDAVGFTQLDRIMSFTCVKNNLADAAKMTPPGCALSAEADIYACNSELLRLAGADIEPPEAVSFLGVTAEIGARIVLTPRFAISLEQMKERVKGKVSISRRSTLVLDGPATIDGLELDGALVVQGGAAIKDKVVKNKGRLLEAIPEAELAASPQSLQIRGYRVVSLEEERLGPA